MIITLTEGELSVRFRVNDDQTVELVHFSTLSNKQDMPLQAAQPEAGIFGAFKPRQFFSRTRNRRVRQRVSRSQARQRQRLCRVAVCGA